MGKIKIIIVDFFNTLSSYDYIGFFLALILFTLFILLALLLRRRTLLSIIFVIIGFAFLFIGPGVAHLIVQKTIFNSQAKTSEVKQLVYSDTLLIKGELLYLGQKSAKHCKVEAILHKYSPSIMKNFVYGLKALRSKSQIIDQPFNTGDKVDFKIVIEPFSYKGDYNITLETGCFK